MKYVVTLLVVCLLVVGCQRGDIKVSMVLENQAAPHEGYNVGPETYVQEGDPCPVTGAVIWIKGAEPNDIFGE